MGRRHFTAADESNGMHMGGRGVRKAAPLADDESGAGVFALLDHLQEVLLLCLAQGLKLLHCVNVHLRETRNPM